MPDTPIFAGLNAEQHRAVECVHGPVCILAGAGSGKTTTISRRIANQVVSGAFKPTEILAVTFTVKAAGELAQRLERLGVAGVQARTFHASALKQLSGLRPGRYDLLKSKVGIVGEAVRSLPAEARKKTALQDLANEIERAKNMRVGPERYEAELPDGGPLLADLMAEVYRRYEQAKQAAGKLDFEDVLEQTIALFETDEAALPLFRDRYRAFTVDEYQDVNLLQQTLLERWLDGRDDLCVVGDDYQAIYSFTGASSHYLLEVPKRYPHATMIRLEANYRSSPQVLEFANKLVPRLGGAEKTLRAADPSAGPKPQLHACEDLSAEVDALVAEIRKLHRQDVPYDEIAVLYRVNYRSADYEPALQQAGIPFQVRGGGFLARPAMKTAMRRLHSSTTAVSATVEVLLADADFEPESNPTGLSAAELTRQQDLALLGQLAREFDDGVRTLSEFAAYLLERFGSDTDRQAVQLLTFHSAKGLEFDAVLLPRLEQGELPYYKRLEQEQRGEERRLFYVGLTRARRHLYLSWNKSRQRSSFLDEIDPRQASSGRPGSAWKQRPGSAPSRPKQPRLGTPRVRNVEPSEPFLKPRLSDDSWRPF